MNKLPINILPGTYKEQLCLFLSRSLSLAEVGRRRKGEADNCSHPQNQIVTKGGQELTGSAGQEKPGHTHTHTLTPWYNGAEGVCRTMNSM